MYSQTKYRDEDGAIHRATKEAARREGKKHYEWVRKAMIKGLPADLRAEVAK